MKPTLLIYYYHPIDHKLRRVALNSGELMREKRLFGDASIVIVHANADSVEQHRARVPEPLTHVNVTADAVRTLYGKMCGSYVRRGDYRVKRCADDLYGVLLTHTSAVGAYIVDDVD